ncbi:TIGR03088 family PEP-CTERM/XrtA system glycosyltransferase [Massilia sp. R2A-15]|uniref:TIGR03088 family PEP-CTERM/XrtA system glycosyltransferase n=1 Tax=Massilia sp. R2A-15 TaxID=3064278 RepID=UPI002732B22F|nr:TIGR03088 family PEP-CTERM/XrtA system glycosyltransferase [Massilia sp. R2A-15]WLI88909.1 TIGR03088 family PEP-CTERM/XrtA system glycosyltransferase [Massilia sp. R2A-15]
MQTVTLNGAAAAAPERPLVVHLTYALDFGGLETLLVECVNRMPAHKYRHAIVCLTRYTDFVSKITQPGVEIVALHKPPGLGLATHARLWALLRRMRPQLLHTYNLAAMEYAFTAAMAGVPIRIHAEHGRDAGDPHGINPKHNFLRRRLAPFIDRYVPVSDDLRGWLRQVVAIPERKISLITNGVDTERFRPGAGGAAPSPWGPDHFVIGTVARVQDIKNHAGLVAAFARLRELLPDQRERLRLSIVGDGPLLPALRAQVAAAGLDDVVWLPGARSDIADLMHSFSLFALPSLAEGTPVSLLEAMASGLPVVASNVGGIPEVIVDGEHGALVAPADTEALAAALARYAGSPALALGHGAAARARIEQRYSMTAMLAAYTGLYDELCAAKLG